ncbi:MAG: HEAT repeat domain-containing protein [Armatimonadota bacterium]
MRLFKPNVPRLKAQKNVNGLVKALTDREVEIREGAARALGELSYPRVVVPLCAGLKDTDWAVRMTVVEALAKIHDARAIEPLVGLLKDEKPAVQKATMEALIAFGGHAVPALSRALSDKAVMARVNAAIALGTIHDVKAVPVLCSALKDTESQVRLHAAESLGMLGDKRAIEPLSEVLQDAERQVTDAAASALQKIGLPTDPASQAKFAVARADWNRAIALGAVAVDALIEGMNNPNTDVRRNAAKSLGVIGDPRAIQPLLNALADEEWFVRESAAWSLGHISDPSISSILTAALRDQRVVVRESAAKALAELSDAQTVGALVEALQDDEYAVAEAAAQALSNIGAPAVGALLTAFRDSPSAVRHAIADALEKIGVPDEPVAQAWYAVVQGDWAKAIELGDLAVEPLIAGLRDDDHRVRRAAAETLGQISQIGAVRAIEPLSLALRDRKADVRKSIAEVLVKIGQPAVDSLIYALNDDEWVAREAAAWALGQIGDMWSVGPLCDALHDPHSAVAEAAALALDEIGVPEEPEVLSWYLVAKKEWQRVTALGSAATEALLHATQDVNPDVRWAATRALGLVCDPDAAAGLRALLHDEEVYVRDAAADALRAIGASFDESAVEAVTPQAGEGTAVTTTNE